MRTLARPARRTGLVVLSENPVDARSVVFADINNILGSFNQNAPQRKFWLGFIPGFGWPYLSVVSAIDVANCRTDDGLGLN